MVATVNSLFKLTVGPSQPEEPTVRKALTVATRSIRIIDSVKAYKPEHLVDYDDVRALSGVLHGDQQATKGILTTTSDFAPGICDDPFLKPLIPYRLELMNGTRLKKWLEQLALL